MAVYGCVLHRPYRGWLVDCSTVTVSVYPMPSWNWMLTAVYHYSTVHTPIDVVYMTLQANKQVNFQIKSLNTVVFTISMSMLGVILEDNATVARLRAISIWKIYQELCTVLCIYNWTLAFFQTVCPGQISWQILPNLASLIRFHPSRQLQWFSPAPKIWEAEWWSGVKNMVTLTRNSLSLQAVQMAQSAIFCNISSYTVNPLIHSVNALGWHEYFITLMLLLFTGYCRGNTVSIWMRSRQNSERIRE